MPESAEKTISVLILDDHALFRESVARLLATEPGIEVVAHSGSIEDALQMLADGIRPELIVILSDINMPGGIAQLQRALRLTLRVRWHAAMRPVSFAPGERSHEPQRPKLLRRSGTQLSDASALKRLFPLL